MSIDINDNTYFKLFYDCMPVKGYTRSIICDMTRHYFDFIPNSLYFILTRYTDKSLDKIFKDFDKEDHPILIEYLEFLYEKEYIFWCTKEELKLLNLSALVAQSFCFHHLQSLWKRSGFQFPSQLM